MWIFRIIYAIFILVIFVFTRDKVDITMEQAVLYSLGVIFAIVFIETLLSDIKSYRFFSGAAGALIFLIIGYYLASIFAAYFTSDALRLAFYVFVIYVGVMIGQKSSWIVEGVISLITIKQPKQPKYSSCPKVLDTSTLIDGRIADIVETGVLEGALVIPTFVLKELQNIADSHDHLRRQKGRRGLNVLKRLQEQTIIPVDINNTDFTDIGTVDEKLVALAKKQKASIITTDFNLLKVSEIQQIFALNINTLAMAMRQTVLPGEDFEINVVKDGKEQNQGVGYLDDGTMVVVENGRRLIGKTVKVSVTSLLQTESGRIIFTKVRN
ncbi:PilT protein domain protein [Denitrovibrio acetiphilus DSM 12809]|uniref:PilT protein domain protein n=1 Tax=Denitrovibrio acetiphilus (strain DSM 12809 / NBRC 114555 / N2460) TaxID=522772 RepID=D4H7Y3_DENA2|nr:PIN domain-containing protein [Denitrovibrio acetiphilus]ADD68132.1 PilT protein domain protein [Denitrovibrio acetiphilus DSM 12809]